MSKRIKLPKFRLINQVRGDVDVETYMGRPVVSMKEMSEYVAQSTRNDPGFRRFCPSKLT